MADLLSWAITSRKLVLRQPTSQGLLVGSDRRADRCGAPGGRALLFQSTLTEHYSATEFSRTNQTSLDGGQRLARFMSAPTRQQDVIKILPERRMLLQINDRGGFLAAIIHEKLHSTHVGTLRINGPDVEHRRSVLCLSLTTKSREFAVLECVMLSLSKHLSRCSLHPCFSRLPVRHSLWRRRR